MNGREWRHQRRRSNPLLVYVYVLQSIGPRPRCSSTLQDYHITIPCTSRPFPKFDEHSQIIRSWITYAEVQGELYEDLYSPNALRRPLRSTLRQLAAV